MPTLRETQARFFELITAPESVERTLEARGLSREHVEEIVVGDARRSAPGRLEIYANMYFFRIKEILEGYFPALAAALGEDGFHNLVTDYLQAHPSEDPSVRQVGRKLPELCAAKNEFWGELARLEAARLDCFDAPDEEILTLAEVGTLSSEALGALPLALVKAHAILNCRFAVDEHADVESPRRLIVWRAGVEVFHRALELDEAKLLGSARTFGEVCERLGGEPEEAAACAFQLLARWLTDELIAKF